MKNYSLYIQGLDEEMDGGIPEKHIVMIAGRPGTMKSSIAYNILYNNAKEEGISCLYVTLEQDKENFMYQISKMGFGDEIKNKLHLFDLSMVRKRWQELKDKGDKEDKPGTDKKIENFKRQLDHLRWSTNCELLVIDSLQVIELLFPMENERDQLFHFFRWLKDMKITTMIISGMSPDSNAFSKHDIDFLADGVIEIKIERVGDFSTQRLLRVVKMRGVNHSTDYWSLLFEDGEFRITRAMK